VSGLIDLVYREPGSGRFVVVDYKTDRIEDPQALEERAAGYRAQAQAYVQALAEALQPELAPRFELWFLHAGRIVPLAL
jgi:ATP-dependent exoDNAse (exonuclease V) beta subunit